MPGTYYGYYGDIAERMLPYLTGRKVAIEQRFPGMDRLVYRRHSATTGEDSWIRIDDRDDLLDWARQYAEGFHAHIRSEDRGAWFVIDIDSRNLPTDMARLAAVHAAAVLDEAGLTPLVKYSGSDGFHLMWDVPNLTDISEAELWELERAVVRSVACAVERRLADDRAAQPIRDAVGDGRPLITTANADRENPDALLFDQYILKENANFRVPYSVHPRTGLVAAPIPLTQLATFQEHEATPEKVAAKWPDVPLPQYTMRDVQRALDTWHDDGC